MIDIKKYNQDNIFSKILKKEIPSKCIFEDEFVYAFEDINPQAPIHILIIPKKSFCSLDDFSSQADELTIFSFMRSISRIAKMVNIINGYRIISNIGFDGVKKFLIFMFI